MKCWNCGAEIPDASRFCLACGRETVTKEVPITKPPEGSNTDVRATVLLGLAALVLMFGLFMLLIGFVARPAFLWVALVLLALGTVMLVARTLTLRAYEKRMVRAHELATAKAKCGYCGALNEQRAQRCLACGAPL